MSNLSTLTKQDKDGGYYAIKGFLYQFDQTLIKMFSNPNTRINFECQQDIDYEDFIIQIKHKETANFTFSSIRPAVRQLIDLFQIKPDKKYRLYCHFKDIIPAEEEEHLVRKFTLSELEKILANESDKYDEDIKNAFNKNFELLFLHDYNKSFNLLIELLKTHYNIKNDEIAIYYHAICQTELSRLSIKSRSQRSLSTSDLDKKIINNNEIIFLEGYQNHLSQEKYFKLLKSKYFTHTKSFVAPYERVFIIDHTVNTAYETLIEIIYKISSKFFRPSKSPAPFICIRNFSKDALNSLKRSLLDQQFYFNDGTFFDGDRFRIEELCKKQDPQIGIRFIDEHELSHLNGQLNLVETYEFFTDQVIHIPYQSKHISISIKDTLNILNIIG